MATFNLVPVMTSNTTPSGTVDSDNASVDAFKAFDNNDSTFWTTGTFSTLPMNPHWITYEFTAAQTVTEYYIVSNDFGLPIDFELQGWNGASWDSLDSRIGFAWDPVSAGYRRATITVASPGAYTKYRFYATKYDNSDFLGLMGLELRGDVPEYELAVATFTWDPKPLADFATGDFYELPAADLAFEPAVIEAQYAFSAELPAADLTFEPNAVAFKILTDPTTIARRIYRLTLTGAPDGLEDVVLPFSSFQARYRDEAGVGASSYLSVVIPAATEYADAISARPNGELVLEAGSILFTGETQLQTLMRVSSLVIQDQQGGRGHSVSIYGYGTFTNRSTKEIEIEQVTFRGSGTGLRRIRALLDFNLVPKDIATIQSTGDSFTVDTITYIVSVSIAGASEIMELTELEL